MSHPSKLHSTPYYCVGPRFVLKTSPTRQGMDSTRPLKPCCGIYKVDINACVGGMCEE